MSDYFSRRRAFLVCLPFCLLFGALWGGSAGAGSMAPLAPGAPPLRPENLVGLKALAEEHDLEFPWDEWEALLLAADDTATSNTIDRDGDGLTADVDPNDFNPDSDGDGFIDGYEVAQGTDPLDPESRPALGDVNDDGAANNVDAMVIFHHLLGQYEGPFNAERADIHRDDQVNNTDAIVLFNWLLGNTPFIPTPALPDRVRLVRQDGTGHFTTIQSAIDAATTGSTVLVYPGTYYENLVMPGRDIVLTSTDPYSTPTVAATVIDGSSSGSVITFSGEESLDFILTGFTITSGRADAGGGVNGNGTLAKILRNVISYNEANSFDGDWSILGDSSGGGLYECHGLIMYNTMSHNIAGNESVRLDGLGSAISHSKGYIASNVIYSNYAYGKGVINACHGIISSNIIERNGGGPDSSGGAIFRCNGVVVNNISCFNTAWQGASGMSSSSGMVLNNTFYQNSAMPIDHAQSVIMDLSLALFVNNIVWSEGEHIHDPEYSDILINVHPQYCCIIAYADQGHGNITDNPMLLDPENGNFRLTPVSPCIDAGRAIPGLNIDYYGHIRPYLLNNHDKLGDGSGFDIGASEFSP